MLKINKKGFTIIEVVLVLAIAGLIFLMVFIALPALQRSQRNTRRRQDMARILSAVTEYVANNNTSPVHKATSSWYDKDGASLDEKFPIRYIEENLDESKTSSFDSGKIGRRIYTFGCQDGKSCDKFTDPDGSLYKIAATGPGITDINGYDYIAEFDHVVYIGAGLKCDNNSEGFFEITENPGDAVVRYVLEGRSVYCTDNQ